MKRLLCACALAGAWAGFGMERFPDPQKFVEHYGRELLGEHFKSDMELMAYKGFEFSNAKVGIDRNGFEYVSALVSLVVPRGTAYYRRIGSPSAAGILQTGLSDKLLRVVGHEVCLAINTARRKMVRDECAPVIYGAEPVDIKKLVSPWRTIRIIRLKDGEGVYHPVGGIERAVQWYAAGGDEKSEMFHIPTEPFYTGANGLLSETAIKRLGAVKDGTPEAIQARESYVKRMEGVEAAIKRLNACCETRSEVLAVAPSYVSTNSLPNWIWERQTKVSSDVRGMIADVENKANIRNREADEAVRNARTAEEGRVAVAKAKADGEKSVSQAEERLKDEYQVIRQKSETEFNAALEDCKRMLGLSK